MPLIVAGCAVLPAGQEHGWMYGQEGPSLLPSPLRHWSPSIPPVPLEGQALYLSLPPMLQQLPLSPPTAAWREKCEQHHQPQPWAGLVPHMRGCSRTEAGVFSRRSSSYHPL